MCISELLDNEKKDEIRQLNGKVIIYSNIQNYNFKMHNHNDGSNIVDLKMPQNIDGS